jgi:hypothetical protein
LYANINVSKAQEKAHTAREAPRKASKSAALYADVQAKPPTQKTVSVKPAAAISSNLVDLVEESADKNPESLGTFEGYLC